MLKAILVSSLLFNIGLLAGRLSGFARESFLAASFGIGPETDVAVLMLSLPDLLVNILVGGGIAASLIPEFNRSAVHARTLLFQGLLAFSSVFMVLSLLAGFFMPWVLGVFAPGFTEMQNSLAIGPMQWVMWLVPLTVATGVVAAYLNAHNFFLASSIGTLVINGVIIAGLVFIYLAGGGLPELALFVLLGGLVRLVMQLVAAVRINGWPVLSFTPWLLNKPMWMRFLQVAGAGSVLLSYPVVIRAYASYGEAGDVALVSFATKLVELPLAIAVTFLSVVLFPRLSNAFETDRAQFDVLCVWGIRATLFLSLMALAAIYPVSIALADLVYGYGKMASDDVVVIGQLTAIGLFFMPFLGMATFVAACFNAKHDTITPLLINAVMLVALVFGLESVVQPSPAELVRIMVAAYVGVGCISLLVLFIKQPTLLANVADVLFMPLILATCGVVFVVLTAVLHWMALAQAGIWPILLAALVAGVVVIVASLIIPDVRNLIVKKLFKP